MQVIQHSFQNNNQEFLELHLVGYGLLNRELIIVEVGSLAEVLAALNRDEFYGLSLLEIFPELAAIQESLISLAAHSFSDHLPPKPFVHSLPNHLGHHFTFRFEAVAAIQGILMIVADVGGYEPLSVKYRETQVQLKTIENKLHQQTSYYEALEEQLIESSINLFQTQEDYSDRVARLEALHKISVALSSMRETKALLQLIVEQAAVLLNADSCSVALLDSETGELIFQAAVDDIVGKRIPPGQGIMFRSLREGAVQVVHDVLNDPDHYIHTGEESNLRARSMLAVPLQTPEQKNIGVLAAVNRRETWFSDEDKDLLVIMASYAAIAIENTRLLEQIQDQARELEKKVEERTAELNVLYQRQAALATIEISINEQHELQRVMDQIVAETCRLITPNGHSILILWDEKTQTYTSGASTSPNFPPGFIINRLRKTGGTAQWIIQKQEPMVERDIHHPVFGPPNSMVLEAGLQSFAGAPLLAEGNALGVLYALDRQPHDYLKEDLDFLTAMANRAANAIVKVRLYEAERAQRKEAEARAVELRAREHHLAMLNDITRTAIEQEDLPAMLATIADRLVNLFQASGCYITFWDEERKLTIPTFTNGPTKIPYQHVKVTPDELTITESVLRAGTALFIEDLPNSDFIRPNIKNFIPIKSVLALPLIAGQQKLGAAMLGFNEIRSLSEQEFALGEQVGRQVALAIAKIRAIESAREAAREAETLREAGAIVAETLSQDEAIERILLQLARVIPYDSACVQLLREGYLEIVGGRGWPDLNMVLGLRFPIPGNNPNTVVVAERRSFLISDARSHFPPFREAPHNHILSWLGVPLIVHDTVTGMLALDSKELNYFTPRHAELALAFADQVAVAIENARLFETTQQNEFEAKTARDILHRLNSVPDIVEAFPQVTEGLKELTHCHRISLALLSEDQATFTMVALDQPYPELSKGTTLPVAATSAAPDVLAGRIHITYDLAEESHLPAEKLLYEGGNRSRINVPLQTADGIIGALNLTWLQPNGFLNEHLPILSQVADAIALAVQKDRLYEAQSDRAKKLDELRKVIAIISSELEIQKLYDTLLEHAVSLIDATGGELGIYVEEEKVIEIFACQSMGKDNRGVKIQMDHGVLGQVATSQTPLMLRDYRQRQSLDSTFEEGPWIGVIASPIARAEKLLGVIALVDTRPDRQFSSSDLQILTLFAYHVAITLENARLFQEVQILAKIDELTQIYNRRRLFELGQIEFEKARRHTLSLSAVMFDIDHFKKVNDTFGHAAGDQVMRILAQRCQAEIRTGDIFGRYGGEEFTVLLPLTMANEAFNLAERLRSSISHTPFETERGEIPITISLGVASLTDDIPDLASLIDRADTALLDAKNSGRNRVEVYQHRTDP